MTMTDSLRDDIRPIAIAVLETLGERWTLEELDQSTGVTLVNDTGARVFMQIVWHDASRIRITGEYPRTECSTYDLKRHEITVAVTKSGKQIAGDIVRRLLPGYMTDLRILQERIAKREERETREAQIASMLEVEPDTLTKGNRTQYGWSLRGVGSFSVFTHTGSGKETVDLTLNALTPDEAHELLLVLSDIRKRD